METEWKKDILMSTKLCISDKYFRKHSFSFDKTHFVLMGTHYDAAFLHKRGSHNIESIFQVSVHISRVVDSSREWLIAPPAPQYQTFPVVTQLYFTGSGVHCPSSVSRTFTGSWPLLRCSPVWRGLSSVSLRQLPGSHPRLTSCRTRGCCLRPSRAPSTGGGWPGVFRGIMRLLMSGDSLPRYPCHPEHRARIRLPIKTLSLIRKTNGHELLWKSW